MPDLYFSIDAEFTGPCPPMYSMLSFASVAFSLEEGVISEFSANLELLPDTKWEPSTQAFWQDYPEALAQSRTNLLEPKQALRLFDMHIQTTRKGYDNIIFLEYPGGCDFCYLYWYFHNFLGYCPFGHQSFSVKSYASALIKEPFTKAVKRNLPERWFDDNLPHTHIALDDARAQAFTAISMMCDTMGKELPWNNEGTRPGDL